jgi:hypothetical protein
MIQKYKEAIEWAKDTITYNKRGKGEGKHLQNLLNYIEELEDSINTQKSEYQ